VYLHVHVGFICAA